ncbi:copper-containing nitrite reductase [Ramlibacter sp.]|uniref:copper-containing nitrite reductase n=1 Tax=Ramlibacter sp. TaxID=1917967 RepID=UPI002C9D3C9C|nr:copper-containing nitrite reductase [Ramlibacter sp.]HWI80498.1 copper-containing nitrite reductase [Ramlibacter sp.]
MFARVFAPIPLAIVVLLSAGPLTIASIGATAATARTAATPVAAKAAAPAAKGAVHKIALKTGMADGKMVFLDGHGQANPPLRANVGDTLEITIGSGEGAEHDIVFPELNVQSQKFSAASGPTVLRFTVAQAGKFTYYCSVPGHRQIGMEGTLEVSGPAGAAVAARPSAPNTAVLGAAAASAKPIAAAAADAVSIVMDPTQVPKAIGNRPPQLVKYSIETAELNGKLDDGTTFTYWTFNKKVPGPMLRVKQGDTVELTLSNLKSSRMVHSIDLHAVTGGHGGGADTQVAPGESKTVRFKALNPGLYVYHCATPSVPHHISAGMYGMILVEPPQGLPKVDREFYVMQGDLYTSHAKGTKGHQEFNNERADDELPTYYTFNGAVGALTKEFKLAAKVGETVRVYFGVGGPNKVSSFHAIGEIFDKVYSEGSISSVRHDVQTTLVPPGGATIVDFKLNYPGKYLLVDHALSRAGKGLGAALEVTGPADGTVYQAMDPHGAGSH